VSTVVKCFWILDGSEKAYSLRQEIKNHGGYWVEDHRSWCIDDPDESTINVFRMAGLIVQFRKYRGVK